jgi:PAS domain S-box-containing protein
MRSLYAPAVALMRRLKYPEKFALVGTLFILPLIVVLVLFLGEIHRTRDIAERELAGNRYVHGLRMLLEDLQEHRGLSNAVLSGARSLAGAQREADARIQTHIQRVDSLDQRLGTLLSTTGRWSALRSEWAALRMRNAQLMPRETVEQHTILISHVLDLIRHVGNTSSLLLDPELRSHHLMAVVVDGLPTLTERIAQVRAWSSAAAAQTATGTRERYLFTELNSVIGAELVTMRRSLTAAFLEDSRMRAAIEPLLHETIAETRNYMRLLIEQLMIDEAKPLPPRELWQRGGAATTAAYRLYDQTSDALDRIVTARFDQLKARETLVTIHTLLALLAAIYLFVGFYRGVMGTVTKLAKAAKRMAAGKIEEPVPLPDSNRDELMIASQAFATLAARLRTEWRSAQGKRAEAVAFAARLQENEARTTAIMDGAADGIITIDDQGSVLSFNSAAKLMFGYSASEVLGQNVGMLMPDPHRSGHDEYIARYIRTGVSTAIGRRREIEGLRQDGTRFPMRIAVSEMLWEGRRVFTGIITDLSLQRRTEEELRQAHAAAVEANRMTAAFLRNVSHAFRTPLNGILGMADLASEAAPNGEQLEFLRTIHAEADSLLSVLSDILDYSKLEAGELELETVPFSLRESLRDTLKPFAVRAQFRDVELVCDVAADVPDALEGDLSRLRQVLGKLVENAVKYTRHGETVVSVTPVSLTDDAVTLQLSVSDTGPGISPEHLESIFKPFAHAGKLQSDHPGGTGLGLTIASQLVEMMGGQLRVDSELGSGTTFRFTVTVQLDHRSETQAIGVDELHDTRVLVVDDNASSRNALIAVFRGWDAVTEAIDNGEAALAVLRQAHADGHPFQLAVLDAQLSDLDGFALATQIRRDPRLAAMPLLVVTASGQKADFDHTNALGAAACFTKPFVVTPDLCTRVRDVLASACGDAAGVAEAERRTARARASLSVLLVEDDNVSRLVTQRLVERAGHAVVTVKNGRQAFETVQQQRFDVILMDVQMPEMNGLEATAAIREWEEDTGDHVPIMALTAFAMAGDGERCLNAGMDAYLTKPVRAPELFATIERLRRQIHRPGDAAVEDAPAPQILDVEALRSQAGDDPTALFDLASRLLSESRQLLERTQEQLQSGDRTAVEHSAHQLRESLGTLTASAARAAALRLEAFARAGDLSQASDVMSTLEGEVARLAPEITSLQPDSPS